MLRCSKLSTGLQPFMSSCRAFSIRWLVGFRSRSLIRPACLPCLMLVSLPFFDGLDICPRLCNSAGAMLCVYNAWFRQPPAANRHLLKKAFGFPLSLVRAFLRFKTGSHNLPSVTGRFFWHSPASSKVSALCVWGSM